MDENSTHPPNPNPEQLDAERLLALEAAYDLDTPQQMTIVAKVTPVTLAENPLESLSQRNGVVLTIRNPLGVWRFVLERDDALAWSRELKRAALGGSPLKLPN